MTTRRSYKRCDRDLTISLRCPLPERRNTELDLHIASCGYDATSGDQTAMRKVKDTVAVYDRGSFHFDLESNCPAFVARPAHDSLSRAVGRVVTFPDSMAGRGQDRSGVPTATRTGLGGAAETNGLADT